MSDVLVLVDFDNIEKGESRTGLEYVVRKVLSICEPKIGASALRAVVRLYGGWYEHGRLTQPAQRLVVDIANISPVRIVRSDGSMLWANVELASSLLADPATSVNSLF